MSELVLILTSKSFANAHAVKLLYFLELLYAHNPARDANIVVNHKKLLALMQCSHKCLIDALLILDEDGFISFKLANRDIAFTMLNSSFNNQPDYLALLSSPTSNIFYNHRDRLATDIDQIVFDYKNILVRPKTRAK